MSISFPMDMYKLYILLYVCTILIPYSAYGVAVYGEIIALRCLVHEFETPVTQVFISGKNLRASRSYLSNCGVEAATVIPALVTEGNFSGPFCFDFKTDMHGAVRFYEVNPRLCGNMAKNEEMFKALIIPLAFAIQKLKEEEAKQQDTCFLGLDNTCIYPEISTPEWYKENHPNYDKLGAIVQRETHFYKEFIHNPVPFDYTVELTW